MIGIAYMELMGELEGDPRDFWTSIEWAAETLTTTGYGNDTHWREPLMVVFVIVVQFLGLFLVFLLFPVYVIPFFEERFEARLPNALPRSRGKRYILIYRYGPAVSALIGELARYQRRVVVLEENDATARRLHEKGMEVVRAPDDLNELGFDHIGHARTIVANGRDQDNATLLLIARDHGFEGPVIALVEDPLHRKPLTALGAKAVYTPDYLLASALAAGASRRISPCLPGIQQLGEYLGVAELRIHENSPLAGEVLSQTHLRERHRVVVLGMWHRGRFVPRPHADAPLHPGDIILVVGRPSVLEGLGRLASPLTRRGPIVVAGYGKVGREVRQMLEDAGERTVVIDRMPGEGVDVVGNVLHRNMIERAGVASASAVVLALSSDSECLFAATVVREFAPDVVLVAGVNRERAVHRLYGVGADFALSMGKVAGQLLARHLLGE
ncbi:MAG: NAD-binding protein, partial [Pseudomonadota bacterium]|nr:NAD-binding protein [Pseudomonadota bacterium]